ncbi:hypothetical protein M8J77_006668 [Diaphorina citri]|nr:hypothetical protein M8J77_006668 [Diaphorina citri]
MDEMIKGLQVVRWGSIILDRIVVEAKSKVQLGPMLLKNMTTVHTKYQHYQPRSSSSHNTFNERSNIYRKWD